MDVEELRRWLQRRDASEGGLLERHARAFVHGQQTASAERAVLLDRIAPGILELTHWPWSALDSTRCTARALRRHQVDLDLLPFPAYQTQSLSSTDSDCGKSVAARWLHARHFFRMLVKFRLLQMEADEIGMAACGGQLLGSFEEALGHPAVAATEEIVFPALDAMLTSSILVNFYSAGSRYGFKCRRDERVSASHRSGSKRRLL